MVDCDTKEQILCTHFSLYVSIPYIIMWFVASSYEGTSVAAALIRHFVVFPSHNSVPLHLEVTDKCLLLAPARGTERGAYRILHENLPKENRHKL